MVFKTSYDSCLPNIMKLIKYDLTIIFLMRRIKRANHSNVNLINYEIKLFKQSILSKHFSIDSRFCTCININCCIGCCTAANLTVFDDLSNLVTNDCFYCYYCRPPRSQTYLASWRAVSQTG
jgi:hypothetical protein